MSILGNPRVRKEVFYTLPAYTTVLFPSTASISDMGEPEFLEERGGLTTKTITGATGTTTVTITATAHGFTTGDEITVGGLVGFAGAHGIWGITVSDADSFVLNGAVGTGTYSSGGVAVKSSEQFSEVQKRDRIESVGNVSVLGEYAWLEDAFRFRPCPTARQLRIVYLSSGTPPTQTTDSIGIDDAIDFLAHATAGSFAQSRGAGTQGASLLEHAYGPQFFQDGALGGLLYELQAQPILTMQRDDDNQVRRFRERRDDDFLI
jgi:hypothetical protein